MYPKNRLVTIMAINFLSKKISPAKILFSVVFAVLIGVLFGLSVEYVSQNLLLKNIVGVSACLTSYVGLLKYLPNL